MDIQFARIDGRSPWFLGTVAILTLFTVTGFFATFVLIKNGLYLTGMTNRIPWGVQITMAVYYIGLSAGSLVVSGLYGVFGKVEYKPFARLAAYLAMLFLIAGLLSILTDQGRMDRVFVEPITHFNAMSMFSINPGLYMGHIVLCILYLWALFAEKTRLVKIFAVTVVAWAFVVHTGTGAILGFIPRELHQSPLLPPSFVAAAMSSGTALMIIILTTLFKVTGRRIDDDLIVWLGKLLGVVLLVVMYLLIVENAYRFYLIESREAARYFLFGGVHSILFWVGLMLIGSVIPVVLLFHPKTGRKIRWIVFSAALVVFGVLCERYVIVIPGQTNPPHIFPGMEITQSDLAEGFVEYTISGYELMQALGVLGVVGLMFLLGLKFLKLAPTEARALDRPKPPDA